MRQLTTRPSSAFRWINCPGNPRVQSIADQLPQEPEDPYAAEGTIGHSWLEFYLGGTDGPPKNEDGAILEIPEGDKKLIGSIADDVMQYAEMCGYQLETEKEYKLAGRISDGRKIEVSGHIDVLLSNNDSLVVLDYKHGAGRHVDVVDNPQTLLYLLCAIHGRRGNGQPPAKNHAMGIIQPRGVGDGWTMVHVPQTKLDTFKKQVVNAINLAYQPTVEYIPGDHCWKCPGQRGLCPAVLTRAIDCISSNGGDPANYGHLHPWGLLDTFDSTKKFIEKLESYADTWLRSGQTIPGWGLETVTCRRAWSHPEEVAGALAEILGGDRAQYERITKTPITLTDAEREAKEKGKKIDGLIRKPVTQKRVKTENENPLGFTKVE